MGKKIFSDVANTHQLHTYARDFQSRLGRMTEREGGVSRADPEAIAALVSSAEKLGVIDRFSRSASGVIFLQEQDAILSGERPLKHTEAKAVVGFIMNLSK